MRTLTRTLITATIFTATLNPDTAVAAASGATINTATRTADAKSCEGYADKINRLQALNTRGGTAKQEAQRRKKISDYETALHHCRNHQTLKVAYGQQTTIRNYHPKIRINANQPPHLQQLIATCNYWVEQTQQYPSWHNSNFRDSACRAADESQKAMHNPSAKTSPNLRKLSDCIKPNNVIDQQVNDCIKGTRTASWKNMH